MLVEKHSPKPALIPKAVLVEMHSLKPALVLKPAFVEKHSLKPALVVKPALVKPALSGMYLCYICEQYSRHQLQCRACGSDTPMCPECFMELHGQCRQRDQEWLFPSARNGSWTAVVTDGENRVVLDSCPLFMSLLVCKVAEALVDDASCRSPLLVVCPAAGWAVARCCFLDFEPVQHFGGGANFRL